MQYHQILLMLQDTFSRQEPPIKINVPKRVLFLSKQLVACAGINVLHTNLTHIYPLILKTYTSRYPEKMGNRQRQTPAH
jgi:hypothetical protein